MDHTVKIPIYLVIIVHGKHSCSKLTTSCLSTQVLCYILSTASLGSIQNDNRSIFHFFLKKKKKKKLYDSAQHKSKISLFIFFFFSLLFFFYLSLSVDNSDDHKSSIQLPRLCTDGCFGLSYLWSDLSFFTRLEYRKNRTRCSSLFLTSVSSISTENIVKRTRKELY